MSAPETRRKRIGFLTGTLNAMAGAERMTATIANGLAERGYEVGVLSLWDKDSCFPLHPAVTHDNLFDARPSFKRAYIPTIAGIRRYVKKHRIDFLVLVDTMLSLFTVPALAGLDVRQIAWEHCHFDEDLGRRSRRHARRLAAWTCSQIVVLTDRDRSRWMAALRPRGTVNFIPNALPFPMPEQPAARENRTVLAVGRLTHAKGFDVLIEAWGRVAKTAPGWRLRIVGEGEQRLELEALRARLGLDDSVSLPGACQDIASAYREASIFCLSSRYEGFGLVLIEAMAHALPIVSTNCETGPRELLENGKDARLVAVDDAPMLATALSDLIRDPHAAEALGAQGRAKAARYDAEQVIAHWEAMLSG